MNLILLHHEDFVADGRVRITDRRLQHVITVHRASAGDELVTGLLGGRIGKGTIAHLDDAVLEMNVVLDRDPPAPQPITVILALPRPKVLRRVLFGLTALGVKHVVLLNSVRVEKSYWQTPFLQEDAIRRQLLLGLEQSCDTMPPEVLLRSRFKPFVEDELPGLISGTIALVAHPTAHAPCPHVVNGPITLAIGPEGGFVPYEIGKLQDAGFNAVSVGSRILNVESAVPYLIAKLSPL